MSSAPHDLPAVTPNEPASKSSSETSLGPSAKPQPATGLQQKNRAAFSELKWHESWIIRAAAMASFILFCGYVLSAYFTIQSIDSIANLAHDDEIERALGEHLNNIKKLHVINLQLAEERLKPYVDRHLASKAEAVDEITLTHWLEQIDLSFFASPKYIKIIPVEKLHLEASDTKLPIKWLDRERLKVLNQVLEFPKGPAYEAFKAAEDVRQRYQVIGAKLDEHILPTLVQVHILTLLGSFLLLAGIFVLYARNFKVRIGEVIGGFSEWSENSSQFRFDDSYKGELRLITGQFNAMADEVEANRQRSLYLEKIASWQIIARKLAHEIKNPLTPIQMMVSQLKRRYKGSDEAFIKLLDNAQNIISEEVAGLRRMVDNFSNFARLPMPELKPTDAVPLCRHVIELQKAAFDQHSLRFESALTQCLIAIDEDLIRQMLLNLIKNACEACGETPSDIRLTLEDSLKEIVLCVKDNGPGIPSELQPRIFEAYFTTKHTGPSPGMGLGLAVCQKIAIDHGGTMSVKSIPGDTTFMIRIPKQTKGVKLTS